MLSTIFKNAIQTTFKTLDGNFDVFINEVAEELQIESEALKIAMIKHFSVFSSVPVKESLGKEQKKQEAEMKKKQKEEEKEKKKQEAEMKKQRSLEQEKTQAPVSSSLSSVDESNELLFQEIPMYDITNEYWKTKGVTIDGKKLKFHEPTEFLLDIDENGCLLHGMLLNKKKFINISEIDEEIINKAIELGINVY